MTSASEATGVVRAARAEGLPIVVSSTVETDGALPGGAALGEFINAVDAETESYPLFYMVNCAHPSHLESTLAAAQRNQESWLRRFKGLRANASTKSHEELDNSTELDAGDAADLATRLADMQRQFDLSVLGGCCGTDATHIHAIASAAGR
jgi:S-methylmethionine-dependent homocysteine/selenocysteine methylase